MSNMEEVGPGCSLDLNKVAGLFGKRRMRYTWRQSWPFSHVNMDVSAMAGMGFDEVFW
jgi:hypothetical protein